MKHFSWYSLFFIVLFIASLFMNYVEFRHKLIDLPTFIDKGFEYPVLPLFPVLMGLNALVFRKKVNLWRILFFVGSLVIMAGVTYVFAIVIKYRILKYPVTRIPRAGLFVGVFSVAGFCFLMVRHMTLLGLKNRLVRDDLIDNDL